ncbi:hypothetical protein [Achromobacter deleyi]|uniref:hypothetical protein n=1 Tax=Achromobacter deleyi TaxID=1353891 RepID=UPI00149238D2|nr:hypothetical protein [Achromobacter deleyi]QVQ27043.1 hypothetical protein HLG70_00855 [Achromobacter deleyi]UIP22627.1 hypothetical protein LYZ39_08955 [Achromobacter deleyi]
MSTQTLSRCAAALLLIALAAGCSSSKPQASGKTGSTSASASKSNECKSNRGKCLYQGPYESGERDYAEQEAKRLNLAELERLRRSFGK